MHGVLVAAGVVLVLIILIHIVFRIIKFTVIVFLLGIALIGVVYVFHTYFGIDLISVMGDHAATTGSQY